MNKEESLDLLKHLILQLRDHSKEIQADPNLIRDWTAKAKHARYSLSLLNSIDRAYVEVEYSRFFQKEIAPTISKLDPSILKNA